MLRNVRKFLRKHWRIILIVVTVILLYRRFVLEPFVEGNRGWSKVPPDHTHTKHDHKFHASCGRKISFLQRAIKNCAKAHKACMAKLSGGAQGGAAAAAPPAAPTAPAAPAAPSGAGGGAGAVVAAASGAKKKAP